MNSFINVSGKIFPAGEPVFPAENRGLRYGDGLFETIRILNGEILFFKDHIVRMVAGMRALGLEVPESYSEFFFHKQLLDLAALNNIKEHGRIRITVFRSGAGLYEPQTNAPGYFIEIFSLKDSFRWIDEKYEVEVFTGVPKDYSAISFFKSLNALPYVMAAISKKEKQIEDCLLVNSSGNIADAISSNVFWIEGQNIFSVPVADGGVDGVMRKQVINLLAAHQISFQEKSISPVMLAEADECFLTNVRWGIRAVTKFQNKSFVTRQTQALFDLMLAELESE